MNECDYIHEAKPSVAVQQTHDVDQVNMLDHGGFKKTLSTCGGHHLLRVARLPVTGF